MQGGVVVIPCNKALLPPLTPGLWFRSPFFKGFGSCSGSPYLKVDAPALKGEIHAQTTAYFCTASQVLYDKLYFFIHSKSICNPVQGIIPCTRPFVRPLWALLQVFWRLYATDWLGAVPESYQMASSDDGAHSFRASSWLELEIRLDGNSLPSCCTLGREKKKKKKQC